MNDENFRAFLDLMMCSDPWPVADLGSGDGHDKMIAFANEESRDRGFEDWIDAYHRFKP